MDPSEQDARQQANDLSAALDRLWIRFLPEIDQRVAILESAAAAASGGLLTPQQQEAARAAAHKLAGVLGTFGLAGGTAPARKTEDIYGSGTAPNSQKAELLVVYAAELRALLETRRQS